MREAQDLYAIVAPGLTLPGRHHERTWRYQAVRITGILLTLVLVAALFFRNRLPFFQTQDFRDDRIYVLPFVNTSGDPGLDIYSEMAKDWITNDLIHTTNAIVFQGKSVSEYTKADISGGATNTNPFHRIEADLVIQGAFALTEKSKDSLFFTAKIIRTKTNEVIPVRIPNTTCGKAEIRTCLHQLSEAITGYWQRKNVSLYSHPTNEAYDAYWKAKHHWAEPNKSIALNFLRQAIRLDTTFLDAYFLLIDGLSNEEWYGAAIDTLKLIKIRFPALNESQSNIVKYYEEDLKGNRSLAFEYFMKEYKKSPDEIFSYTSALVMTTEYLNDPLTTIRLSKAIDMEGLDLNTCHYCRTSMLMAMIAYRSLSDVANATKLAEQLKLQVLRRSEFTRLTEFYISIADTLTLESILGRLASDSTRASYLPYLNYNAARQFLLRGQPRLKDIYARRAAALYQAQGGRNYARCLYLLGDLKGAEDIYTQLIANDKAGISSFGELGMIYARTNRFNEAREMIAQLHIRDHPLLYGDIEYLEGRILAYMGKKKEALASLGKALDEGYVFNGDSFQNDPDLIQLFSEPEFIKLLGRNRLMPKPAK